MHYKKYPSCFLTLSILHKLTHFLSKYLHVEGQANLTNSRKTVNDLLFYVKYLIITYFLNYLHISHSTYIHVIIFALCLSTSPNQNHPSHLPFLCSFLLPFLIVSLPVRQKSCHVYIIMGMLYMSYYLLLHCFPCTFT